MQYTALYMKASSACNSMIRNKHHVFGILKSVIIHILKVGVIKTNKSRHQYHRVGEVMTLKETEVLKN